MIQKIQKIQKIVCSELNIKRKDILRHVEGFYFKSCRKKEFVLARQLIIHIIKEEFPKWSLSYIGIESGFDYSHSSVLYCDRMIKNRLSYDKKFIASYKKIRFLITNVLDLEILQKELYDEVSKCENSEKIINLIKKLGWNINQSKSLAYV